MKKSIILIGIMALGLILLAGCRQRPREVELETKELVPLEEVIPLEEVVPPEEMTPLEPRVEEAPMVAETPFIVAPADVTGKININTATQAQLETLPRVGPKTAQAIIAHRPFSSIEDITRTHRIGPKAYEGLKDLITVGEVTAPAGVPAAAPFAVAPADVTGKININTATQAQLETLPRIGPKTAQAIIANRPFSSIEEITKVPRIGPKTYEGLKDLITVK